MGDLFEKIETKKLPYKAEELPKQPTGEYSLPCLTSSFRNQGLNYYAPRKGAIILKNVVTIPQNSDVYRAYFQSIEFTVLSDAYAICWKMDGKIPLENQYLFMVMCINRVTDLPIYSYKNKLGGWNVVKHKNIKLPENKNGDIDFEFMDSFIAELKAERVAELKAERVAELTAYLKISGLDNYELSNEEEKVLANFSKLKWDTFNLEKLFGKATRGKRLKSADRVIGNLPFVTAGEAEEGVSDYIGNDVEIFNANTTTIDMFGSAKYRNYEYGADDHVAVVHTEKLSKNVAIFVTSAIHKSSHNGQYHYGHNFYAKDADVLNIKLPSIDGKPNYDVMEVLISAIHKLVIKDVAKFADTKIQATEQVVSNK